MQQETNVRAFILPAFLFTFIFAPAQLYAQRNPKKEQAFVRSHPAVGDALPDVEVLTPDGRPFRTKDLRGHYAVLTFGCLT